MESTTVASREEAGDSMFTPPRENLVRDVAESVVIRDAEDGSAPVMSLRYVPFGEWTEIRSDWEGNFLERVSPGATLKTISENRDRLKIQFDHGKHPSIGSMLLGTLADIREQPDGGWADVELFDTSYNRDLLPGLRAGVYGASFRFGVMREDKNKNPGKSAHNPRGIPERTIQELRLEELGPVTWPAYAGTKVGVRSATDEYIIRQLFSDSERMQEFARSLVAAGSDDAKEMADFARFYLEQYSAHPFPNGDIFKGDVTITETLYDPEKVAVQVLAQLKKRHFTAADPVRGRRTNEDDFAPADPTPPKGTSEDARRDNPRKFKTSEDWNKWIASI